MGKLGHRISRSHTFTSKDGGGEFCSEVWIPNLTFLSPPTRQVGWFGKVHVGKRAGNSNIFFREKYSEKRHVRYDLNFGTLPMQSSSWEKNNKKGGVASFLSLSSQTKVRRVYCVRTSTFFVRKRQNEKLPLLRRRPHISHTFLQTDRQIRCREKKEKSD